MKIAVQPEWNFTEAIGHAWKAYSGGQELGVPNRIRVLEQWANVVGRERAVKEFEATIASHGGLSTAAEKFGFSTYAFRKIKKSFSQMPSLTPHVLSATSFEDFLRSLPKLDAEKELTFISIVIPQLASFLGYAESEIYFENRPRKDLRALIDVAFAPSGPSTPYIIIEVKQGTLNPDILRSGIERVKKYHELVGATFGVVFSAQHIVVIHSNGRQDSFLLKDITKSSATKIYEVLKRPNKITPAIPIPTAPAGVQLQKLLKQITTAQTNEQKKTSLENLAANVFDVHKQIRCKYKNLRTRSSEIDIVCEIVDRTNSFFLTDYGRYFLVECKNWAAPAGAKEIRDFIGKIRKSRVQLGVFFSRNGITGEANGTDALREIHSAYDQDGISIIVISEQDLSAIEQITDVLAVIEQKLDALRFDF